VHFATILLTLSAAALLCLVERRPAQPAVLRTADAVRPPALLDALDQAGQRLAGNAALVV
jgi:hypothetical protein